MRLTSEMAQRLIPDNFAVNIEKTATVENSQLTITMSMRRDGSTIIGAATCHIGLMWDRDMEPWAFVAMVSYKANSALRSALCCNE